MHSFIPTWVPSPTVQMPTKYLGSCPSSRQELSLSVSDLTRRPSGPSSGLSHGKGERGGEGAGGGSGHGSGDEVASDWVAPILIFFTLSATPSGCARFPRKELEQSRSTCAHLFTPGIVSRIGKPRSLLKLVVTRPVVPVTVESKYVRCHTKNSTVRQYG